MNDIELVNGVTLPMLGYGTLQIPVGNVTQCVLDAFDEGYRLIDTAASYFNEVEIGKAIVQSQLPREEIFLTTKVWVQDAGYENTKKAFYTSLENLGSVYLDVYLIHQPYGDYYGSWRAMEELYLQGKIKAIGVCNFSAERLVDLCLNSRISPMLNQVEFHPMCQQKQLVSIRDEVHCQIQAWGPLNEGQGNIFHHYMLEEIAQKHRKSVAQIMLAWHMQNNRIAIPKSIHRERMKENMDIWDISLDEQDVQKIKSMDLGYSEIIDHSCHKTAKWLSTYKIHE